MGRHRLLVDVDCRAVMAAIMYYFPSISRGNEQVRTTYPRGLVHDGNDDEDRRGGCITARRRGWSTPDDMGVRLP